MNRKLDAKVAEAMGLRPRSHQSPIYGDDWWISHTERMPHYSTDIAAAWQVVEWMREKSIGITISTVGPRHQTSAYTTIKGQSLYKCHVWADSAPEAICLAFLRAMGLDGEGDRD